MDQPRPLHILALEQRLADAYGSAVAAHRERGRAVLVWRDTPAGPIRGFSTHPDAKQAAQAAVRTLKAQPHTRTMSVELVTP